MIWAAVIALFLQAVPAVRQAVAKASISGVVVRSVTGEPIPNVQVTLARIDSPLGQFGDFVSAERPPTEMVLPGAFLEAIKGISPAPGASPAETAALASLQVEDIDQVIVNPTGGVAVVSKSAPPIMTDSQGRFAFAGIAPGSYRLIFSASGYAKQDYGQRVLGGAGTAIALAAGETRGDIVMRLTQVSALSGRILDSRARPIAGVPVQLFRFSYDQTARSQIQIIASTQSDDRGDYRFFFLSPGRYYVRAGHETNEPTRGLVQTPSPFDQSYRSPNRIPQNYALTYYRDVAAVNGAAAIDLQPGADLSGVDFFLGPQRIYHVRGRVIDSRTGQPPRSASIYLRPQTPDLTNSIVGGFTGVGNYSPVDGTFNIQNVTPGSYTLSVEVMNPQPRSVDFGALSAAERNAYFEAMRVEQQARPKGFLSVEVANADVEGLNVVVSATSMISGRIRVEPGANGVPLDVLVVQLKAASDDGPLGSSNPHVGAVKSDGTFTIEGVPMGEYRLSVVGLPPNSYLKGARMAQADVLNVALHVSGTESGTLDIVVSPNAGEINGTVVDSRGQPAPGVQVVLIPDENRHRAELFRPVTSDAKGNFSISAITPGNYKLAAWEVIEPYGFFDPELIKQADQNGKPIRVGESSKQTATVRAW
jgi:protocatechuate 3,4-dioxygenase beta subunit